MEEASLALWHPKGAYVQMRHVGIGWKSGFNDCTNLGRMVVWRYQHFRFYSFFSPPR